MKLLVVAICLFLVADAFAHFGGRRRGGSSDSSDSSSGSRPRHHHRRHMLRHWRRLYANDLHRVAVGVDNQNRNRVRVPEAEPGQVIYVTPQQDTTATGRPTTTTKPRVKRYRVIPGSFTFGNALKACAAMGGTLASPKSQTELDNINNYLGGLNGNPVDVWLGVRGQGAPLNNWATVDRPTSALAVSNWNGAAPNNNGQGALASTTGTFTWTPTAIGTGNDALCEFMQ